MAQTKTVSLKLMVDTKCQRVLFAEAGKDFVDFLFNILSLPIGAVIGLVTKKDFHGSLGNLYESLENLSDAYMQPTAKKDTLLKPKLVSNYAANVPPLLPNLQSSTSTIDIFYRCGYTNYETCRKYVTNVPDVICPYCKNVMAQQATFVTPPKQASSSSDEGGYVKRVATYVIIDDLVVRPASTISCITLLNKFNVKDVGILEEKVIHLGTDEAMKLLKMSLRSKTVLTDVFLGMKVEKSDVTNTNSLAIPSKGTSENAK